VADYIYGPLAAVVSGAIVAIITSLYGRYLLSTRTDSRHKRWVLVALVGVNLVVILGVATIVRQMSSVSYVGGRSAIIHIDKVVFSVNGSAGRSVRRGEAIAVSRNGQLSLISLSYQSPLGGRPDERLAAEAYLIKEFGVDYSSAITTPAMPLQMGNNVIEPFSGGWFLDEESERIVVALVSYTDGTSKTIDRFHVRLSYDPALSSSETMLFFDEFERQKPTWRYLTGDWGISSGLLRQKSAERQTIYNAIAIVDSLRVSDVTIETRVRAKPYESDPADSEDRGHYIRFIIGGGILFRYKDPDNYYMFRLAGEEGAVLGKMVGGEYYDIQNPRVRDFLEGRIGFAEQDRYVLRVEAYGDRITCFIDGQAVCSVVDSTFSIGQVGLLTFMAAADFDYFRASRRF
jgi:hypothetical protein